MPTSRHRRRAFRPSQRDLMIAAASHCRHEGRATRASTAPGSELHRRLEAVAEAIDDLMGLPEMAGDRGHLRPVPDAAGGYP
ncbi:MAG TPA: hypothetical protein VEX11_11710 [Acetobacteraceae bacterium]|nr:hypothetical protein [Acetobacteraceae bacterium]